MKIGANTIIDCKIGNQDVNKIYIGNTFIWERVSLVLLPETQAILDEATALSYTLPSMSTIIAMDTLIGEMISTGFWAKQDILFHWMYNATNLNDFCLINWKNPSGQKGSYVEAILQQTTYGLLGDYDYGNIGYFSTNFNPSINGVNYQVNNASRTILIHTVSELTAGRNEGNNSGNNSITNTTSNGHRINSLNNLSWSTTMNEVGLRSLVRLTNTQVRALRGDSKFTGSQTAQASRPNAVQNVFRDTPGNNSSNSVISMYAMGASISDAEYDSMRVAYDAYISAIGLIPFS